MTDKTKHSYSVNLLIIHPSIDPKTISFTLGIEPDYSRMAGKEWFTPKGTSLGLSKDTRWSCSNEIKDGEQFFNPVKKIVDKFYRHKDFLKKIVSEGGRAELFVNLPGKKNQGASLDSITLGKMSEMSLELGVEVFPDWDLEE